MRKLFLSLLLLFSIAVNSQTDSGTVKTGTVDSVITRAQDSLRGTEIRNYDENNARHLESLMKDLEARRAREKTGAFIRIGFGLLLLAVLIIGWRRKRKK